MSKSYKDKNHNFGKNCDNLNLTEDNAHIFSLSSLKSKKFILSDCFNSFNLYFSKNKTNQNDINKIESTNLNNSRIISLKESDTNESKNCLRKINFELPSLIKIWEPKLKNDFLNDYEDSLANYFGINKEQFKDAFINNQYILFLSEFGDINISKKIIDLIKSDSYSIKSETNKKMLKKKKYMFKTKFTNSEKNKNFGKSGEKIVVKNININKNENIKNKFNYKKEKNNKINILINDDEKNNLIFQKIDENITTLSINKIQNELIQNNGNKNNQLSPIVSPIFRNSFDDDFFQFPSFFNFNNNSYFSFLN